MLLKIYIHTPNQSNTILDSTFFQKGMTKSSTNVQFEIKNPKIKKINKEEFKRIREYLRHRPPHRKIAEHFPNTSPYELMEKVKKFNISSGQNSKTIRKLFDLIHYYEKKPLDLLESEKKQIYEQIRTKLDEIFQKNTEISKKYNTSKNSDKIFKVCSYQWKNKKPPKDNFLQQKLIQYYHRWGGLLGSYFWFETSDKKIWSAKDISGIKTTIAHYETIIDPSKNYEVRQKTFDKLISSNQSDFHYFLEKIRDFDRDPLPDDRKKWLETWMIDLIKYYEEKKDMRKISHTYKCFQTLYNKNHKLTNKKSPHEILESPYIIARMKEIDHLFKTDFQTSSANLERTEKMIKKLQNPESADPDVGKLITQEDRLWEVQKIKRQMKKKQIDLIQQSKQRLYKNYSFFKEKYLNKKRLIENYRKKLKLGLLKDFKAKEIIPVSEYLSKLMKIDTDFNKLKKMEILARDKTIQTKINQIEKEHKKLMAIKDLNEKHKLNSESDKITTCPRSSYEKEEDEDLVQMDGATLTKVGVSDEATPAAVGVSGEAASTNPAKDIPTTLSPMPSAATSGYGFNQSHQGFGHQGFGHQGFGHQGFGHQGFGRQGFGRQGYQAPSHVSLPEGKIIDSSSVKIIEISVDLYIYEDCSIQGKILTKCKDAKSELLKSWKDPCFETEDHKKYTQEKGVPKTFMEYIDRRFLSGDDDFGPDITQNPVPPPQLKFIKDNRPQLEQRKQQLKKYTPQTLGEWKLTFFLYHIFWFSIYGAGAQTFAEGLDYPQCFLYDPRYQYLSLVFKDRAICKYLYNNKPPKRQQLLQHIQFLYNITPTRKTHASWSGVKQRFQKAAENAHFMLKTKNLLDICQIKKEFIYFPKYRSHMDFIISPNTFESPLLDAEKITTALSAPHNLDYHWGKINYKGSLTKKGKRIKKCPRWKARGRAQCFATSADECWTLKGLHYQYIYKNKMCLTIPQAFTERILSLGPYNSPDNSTRPFTAKELLNYWIFSAGNKIDNDQYFHLIMDSCRNEIHSATKIEDALKIYENCHQLSLGSKEEIPREQILYRSIAKSYLEKNKMLKGFEFYKIQSESTQAVAYFNSNYERFNYDTRFISLWNLRKKYSCGEFSGNFYHGGGESPAIHFSKMDISPTMNLYTQKKYNQLRSVNAKESISMWNICIFNDQLFDDEVQNEGILRRKRYNVKPLFINKQNFSVIAPNNPLYNFIKFLIFDPPTPLRTVLYNFTQPHSKFIFQKTGDCITFSLKEDKTDVYLKLYKYQTIWTSMKPNKTNHDLLENIYQIAQDPQMKRSEQGTFEVVREHHVHTQGIEASAQPPGKPDTPAPISSPSASNGDATTAKTKVDATDSEKDIAQQAVNRKDVFNSFKNLMKRMAQMPVGRIPRGDHAGGINLKPLPLKNPDAALQEGEGARVLNEAHIKFKYAKERGWPIETLKIAVAKFVNPKIRMSKEGRNLLHNFLGYEQEAAHEWWPHALNAMHVELKHPTRGTSEIDEVRKSGRTVRVITCGTAAAHTRNDTTDYLAGLAMRLVPQRPRQGEHARGRLYHDGSEHFRHYRAIANLSPEDARKTIFQHFARNQMGNVNCPKCNPKLTAREAELLLQRSTRLQEVVAQELSKEDDDKLREINAELKKVTNHPKWVKKPATEEIKIDTLPIILAVGINRFKTRYKTNAEGKLTNAAGKVVQPWSREEVVEQSKIRTAIIIDETLDLAPYITDAERTRVTNGDLDTKYTLVSILRHSGATLNSGHYTADCRINTTGKQGEEKWYHFNDVFNSPGLISRPAVGTDTTKKPKDWDPLRRGVWEEPLGYPNDLRARAQAVHLFYVRNDKLGKPQEYRRKDICNLENLTTTCYMSAAIQCLFSLTPFRKIFLDNQVKGGEYELMPHLDAEGEAPKEEDCKADEWRCPACTYCNKSASTQCEMCKERQPAATSGGSGEGGAPAQPPSSATTGGGQFSWVALPNKTGLWRQLEEGEGVPVGSEVSMDMQSGKNFVKKTSA